jgi:hypothetical protein
MTREVASRSDLGRLTGYTTPYAYGEKAGAGFRKSVRTSGRGWSRPTSGMARARWVLAWTKEQDADDDRCQDPREGGLQAAERA